MRRVLVLAVLLGCGSEAKPSGAGEAAAADSVWRVARDAADLVELEHERLKARESAAREAVAAARPEERAAAEATLAATARERGRVEARMRKVKAETFRAEREKRILWDGACPENPLARGC